MNLSKLEPLFTRARTQYVFRISNRRLGMQQFHLIFTLRSGCRHSHYECKHSLKYFSGHPLASIITVRDLGPPMCSWFFGRLLVNGQFWACGQGVNLNTAQILHSLTLSLTMDFSSTQLQESWWGLWAQIVKLKTWRGDFMWKPPEEDDAK